ncbi:MAG: riboflavin kinase [Planctomycetota bacterium]
MQRFSGFSVGDPVAVARGGAVTIGVFDGVHVGHQTILHEVRAWAKALAGPAGVVTFATHPDVILRGKAPKLLMSLEHRLRVFASLDLDYAIVLPFSERVREITAEEFSREVFSRALGVRGLVLGHDTAIGRNREGDARRLTELGQRHGYVVRVIGEVTAGNQVVSSTRIRAAIDDGDLETTALMLGRPLSLLGRVVRGDGRGRQLGFATANLDLEQDACPRRGVYAARVLIDGSPGGTRPGLQHRHAPHVQAGARDHGRGARARLRARPVRQACRGDADRPLARRDPVPVACGVDRADRARRARCARPSGGMTPCDGSRRCSPLWPLLAADHFELQNGVRVVVLPSPRATRGDRQRVSRRLAGGAARPAAGEQCAGQ